METNEELFSVLAKLVDGWCERRALGPLGIILQGYPMPSPLTDSWVDLRDVLRNLRHFRQPAVTELEANDIEEALRAVEKALDRR
jgi:hypothetical protein